MRDAFFNELFELFVADRRVVFLTGDLGYKLFDRLKIYDPKRVINVGVREGLMIGFAAGLAHAGQLPFAYSIAPFVTLRCLEQIKICLSYNRSRVIVVGVGGGYCYGHNGPTHFGLEDVALMSAIPGMTVWTPADALEVQSCVRAAFDLTGPAYLRLGRNGEPVLRDPGESISPWRAFVRPNRREGVIITNGFLLAEVFRAAKIVQAEGLAPAIVHLPTTEPMDIETLTDILQGGVPVVTTEEHIRSGGLGQRIALFIAEHGLGNPMRCLCAPMHYPKTCLDRNGLLTFAGIDAPSIARAFFDLWSSHRGTP